MPFPARPRGSRRIPGRVFCSFSCSPGNPFETTQTDPAFPPKGGERRRGDAVGAGAGSSPGNAERKIPAAGFRPRATTPDRERTGRSDGFRGKRGAPGRNAQPPPAGRRGRRFPPAGSAAAVPELSSVHTFRRAKAYRLRARHGSDRISRASRSPVRRPRPDDDSRTACPDAGRRSSPFPAVPPQGSCPLCGNPPIPGTPCTTARCCLPKAHPLQSFSPIGQRLSAFLRDRATLGCERAGR